MGKKAKKKARAPPKEKRQVSKNVSEHSTRSDETVEDAVEAVKEKKSCVHFEKSVDLSKVLAKIKKSEPVKCGECKGGVNERRGGKAKGKQVKKKVSASMDPKKSENRAIWVCLECGHYACAGVGLPTGAQSHVVRHVRLTRHRLVIQWENPYLRWCFTCNALLPVDKVEENGEDKDVLTAVVKLIKDKSLHSSADIEDVWSGSSSLTSDIKSEGTILSAIDAKDGYVVRGLVNLGNTCFFNSIMQNLLALDQLREYFLNEDASAGPLNSSLRKLFAETKSEAGLKNVINPRSFFGSVCSNAPQFRGYQQHDSHELLRCLLDGLSTEESSFRKKRGSSDTNGNSVNKDPTVIETVFGGEISSIVSCMECGHSSKVYEPFLDLSLPVPTKKPPPKRLPAATRAKKTKLPQKRVGKARSKANKDADPVPPNPISEQPGSPKKAVASSDDSTLSGSVGLATKSLGIGTVPEIPSAVTPGNEQVSQSMTQGKPEVVDDPAWMDFLGPGTIQDENELAFPDNEGASVSLEDDMSWLDFIGPGTMQGENDFTLQSNDVSSTGVNGTTTESCQANSIVDDPDLRESSSVNTWEDELPVRENFSANPWEYELFAGHNSSVNPWDDKLPTVHDSSVNPWEDELPLQVQDSQVLLLPYKEESSIPAGEVEDISPFMGVGQQELDFDGFGDLFNEPEISVGPVSGPSTRSEVAESGFMAVSSSDSDPNEIDDTDSPVSVESCLAHFTKPEILSNDNAWHCENCSKILQRQKLKEKKKTKLALRTLGSGNGENAGLSDVDINSNNASLTSHNGENDSSKQNCTPFANGQVEKMSPVYSKCDEEKLEEDEASGQTNACRVDVDSATEKPTLENQETNSQLAESSESEGSEDEEVNSEKVTVKRDATKRVLINKVPPILTIHLKRFSQDARGRLSKLNGHISFREFVDLGPYLDPRCKDGGKHIYRLVGVVEHSGTMRGGHYVAYVRGGRRRRKLDEEDNASVWYHVSDSYVRQVSVDEVLRCEAYILFYEMI